MFRFHKINFTIIALVFSAFFLRIILANFGTLYLDHNTFVAWGHMLAENGFASFYDSWSDYLPGFLYILWLLAKIESLFAINTLILYKLPGILADVVAGFAIYRIIQKQKGEKWAIIASTGYLFNPAIFANSTLWGQVDSLTSLFSLLSVWLAVFSWPLSAISLAAGTLVKPQAAFAAIVILFVMYKGRWSFTRVYSYILLAGSVFTLGFLPFAGNKYLFPFIFERLLITSNQYPYTSVNAFNFWGMVGFWRSDTVGIISSQVVGVFLVLVFIFLELWNLMKRKWAGNLDFYRLLAIVFLSVFIFLTRMHERHLLPALAPLSIAAVVSPTLWIPYVFLSLTYLVNLRYSFVWINNDFRSIFSSDMMSMFSAFNVALLVLVLYPLPQKLFSSIALFGKVKLAKASDSFSFREVNLSRFDKRMLLYVILAFTLITRIAFLENPSKEYFDEVYHAFTARTMLQGDPKAWEWWNTPPEGYAYEWTHPPFAKLAMWGSMAILGENSLGWRIPGAITGTVVVFVIYLLAKEIFRDEIAAVLSASIFALDGLGLVMSRIGMNDMYFLLFALTSIYFFIKNKNLLSALALGLAASTKWTTAWLLPIFFVAHFVFRKKITPYYAWFVVIPPLVYLASYIPMFLEGHTWDQFVEVQRQMWWYHTNLEATHAYTSPPLSWPFLARPIWLYTSGLDNGFISNIYAMGNPIVFWVGVVAMIFAAVEAFSTRNKRLGFIVFSYLALFVPWSFSPRIMFLYHYLPAVPFLAMATGYIFRKNLRYILFFFPVAFLLFFYFYPHWTGLRIPEWLDNSYYWTDKWR